MMVTMAVKISGLMEIVGMVFFALFFMCMVAVDNMRWNELMQEAGYKLDTNHPSKETPNKDEASRTRCQTAFL